MNREELRREIFALTKTEKYRRDHPEDRRSKFYDYMEKNGYRDENGFFHLPYSQAPRDSTNPPSDFLERIEKSPCQQDFFLKKATRFSDEPFSYGDFLCIRYVYSGSDEIRTPSGSFVMEKNDICLMNARFVLSQYLAHEDDIVFSLMFEKDYLIKRILHHQNESSVIVQFMYNYVLYGRNRQNYILFHGGDNDCLPRIFEDIVAEYAYPSLDSLALLESYLRALLINMSRSDYDFERHAESKRSFLLAVLVNEISQDYPSITLSRLADKMGYHPDYISRCIKEGTGLNFKDYLLRIRMAHARDLLKNSALSISEVAAAVGYQNETYFYKKFREIYGCTPAKCR